MAVRTTDLTLHIIQMRWHVTKTKHACTTIYPHFKLLDMVLSTYQIGMKKTKPPVADNGCLEEMPPEQHDGWLSLSPPASVLFGRRESWWNGKRANRAVVHCSVVSEFISICLSSLSFSNLFMTTFISSHTNSHLHPPSVSFFFLPWPLCNSFSSPTSSISVVAPLWGPLKLNTSKSRENTKTISWHFSVTAYYLTSTLFLWSLHSKVAFFHLYSSAGPHP